MGFGLPRLVYLSELNKSILHSELSDWRIMCAQYFICDFLIYSDIAIGDVAHIVWSIWLE